LLEDEALQSAVHWRTMQTVWALEISQELGAA
jgi:hypothetical protein